MSAASEAIAAARCFTLKAWECLGSRLCRSPDPSQISQGRFSWQVLATDLAGAEWSTSKPGEGRTLLTQCGTRHIIQLQDEITFAFVL